MKCGDAVSRVGCRVFFEDGLFESEVVGGSVGVLECEGLVDGVV